MLETCRFQKLFRRVSNEKCSDLYEGKQKPRYQKAGDAALELLIDKQVKEDCDYLCKCAYKTTLINATGWFVFDFKGTELVNIPPCIGVPGLGTDYFRLNWNTYKAIKTFVEEKGV